MRMTHVVERLREDCLHAQGEEHVKKVMAMTLRQMKVVVLVSCMTMERPEGIPLKMIAERLKLTLPAASILVEQLVQMGRLERSINPEDRREVRITLSAVGRANFESIRKYMDDAIRELVSDFPPEQLSVFSGVVNKCYEKLYGTINE